MQKQRTREILIKFSEHEIREPKQLQWSRGDVHGAAGNEIQLVDRYILDDTGLQGQGRYLPAAWEQYVATESFKQ